jgi:hypothetical protein
VLAQAHRAIARHRECSQVGTLHCPLGLWQVPVLNRHSSFYIDEIGKYSHLLRTSGQIGFAAAAKRRRHFNYNANNSKFCRNRVS